MIQIKYNQNPGNEPSGKQARNKMKGGRKLGRKEEIIPGQVTKEGCRNHAGLYSVHEDRKDPRSCKK